MILRVRVQLQLTWTGIVFTIRFGQRVTWPASFEVGHPPFAEYQESATLQALSD